MKEHRDNTDLTVQSRRAFVMNAYLSGRYPEDIYEEWQVAYPALSKDSFLMDVHKMYAELKRRGERDLDAIIDKHLHYLNHLYSIATGNGDVSNAVKVLKEIRETLGIGGTKVKNVSLNQTINNNTQLPAMSVEEIRRLLGKSNDEHGVIDITPSTPIE